MSKFKSVSKYTTMLFKNSGLKIEYVLVNALIICLNKRESMCIRVCKCSVLSESSPCLRALTWLGNGICSWNPYGSSPLRFTAFAKGLIVTYFFIRVSLLHKGKTWNMTRKDQQGLAFTDPEIVKVSYRQSTLLLLFTLLKPPCHLWSIIWNFKCSACTQHLRSCLERGCSDLYG